MKDLFGDEPYLERKPHQLARKTDPVTSELAVKYIIPQLREIQRKVYDAIVVAGPQGLTDWELENSFGDHGSTYRTRRAELTELGLVLDSGRKRLQQRPGKPPRLRVVWIARQYISP